MLWVYTIDVIDKMLGLSDEPDCIYQSFSNAIGLYLSPKINRFDLCFFFKFLLSKRSLFLISIFTVSVLIASNKGGMSYLISLLPSDNFSPVQLSQLKVDYADKFWGVFNILYITLQFFCTPTMFSCLLLPKVKLMAL